MSGWQHRLCERCWFDVPPEGSVRPFGDPTGGDYRKPVQIVDPEPGMCAAPAVARR